MAIEADQAMKSRRLLLLGASSQIGVFAILRLIEAGFQVTAVSRKGKPEGFPGYDQVEWLNESDALEASLNCQYLLSAGPLQLAENYLATGSRFQSAVVFSSSSVETKQESGNPQEREQIEYMLALETALRSIAQTSGVKLVVFRPTLIYGCGLDTNVSRLANWIRRFGFIPVSGRAKGLRQPVHADDLASVAVTALLSDVVCSDALSLTGGETLSYSDMVSRIFTALGKPARLLRLPEWLFVLLVNAANRFKAGHGINGEMVRRQKIDLVFDDGPARDLFDFKPRSFEPAARDFSLPSAQTLKE